MENKENNHEEHKNAMPGQERGEEKTVTLKESEYLKLKEEEKRAQECWDKMLRSQAEMENLRKRLEKEKQDFVRFANEGIIAEFLTILDDLERAVELAQEKHQDLQAFLKGVEMILAHFYELLKDYGVRPIDAKGKLFDPNFHEALMQAQEDSLPENTVVEELQKGYLLNDRVIRTAKVKVAKKGT